VETDKSAMIQSYLSKDLFQSYRFPTPATSASLDAFATNENEEQELEEIDFSLDLPILLDCLSLFEESGNSANGSWKNATETDSLVNTEQQGSLTILYTKHGEDLILK
jgi:hypothetical protein